MDRSSRAILILFSFFLVVVGFSLWFSRTPDPALDDGDGENGPAVGTAGEPDRPDVPEDGLRPEPLPPQPGLVISGKVLDAGGRPIEGAVLSLYQGRRWLPSVRLSSDEESDRQRVADLFQYYRADASTLHPLGMDVSSTVERESPVREDVSAADGTFAFEDAPAGRLRVAATYGRLSSGQVDATGGTPLELVLRTKTRLSGKVVVIEDGRPLAGALVRAYQGGRVRAVEADRNGAFVFDDLPAGETTVLATHPDHAGASEQPTLSPGEETVLRLSLGRGHDLVVVARGFHPERPEKKIYLPYTTVVLIREIDRAYVLARTTSDGVATFTNLPPGRYVVNGRRKGYLAAGSAEISLPLPEEQEVEIFLDLAVPSTIRVLDERGYAGSRSTGTARRPSSSRGSPATGSAPSCRRIRRRARSSRPCSCRRASSAGGSPGSTGRRSPGRRYRSSSSPTPAASRARRSSSGRTRRGSSPGRRFRRER